MHRNIIRIIVIDSGDYFGRTLPLPVPYSDIIILTTAIKKLDPDLFDIEKYYQEVEARKEAFMDEQVKEDPDWKLYPLPYRDKLHPVLDWWNRKPSIITRKYQSCRNC